MSRADYAHWNEDADYMWWHEEGKHAGEQEPPDPDDESWRDEPPEGDDEDRCRRCDSLYDCKTNAKGDHWPYCDDCFVERLQERSVH